MGEAHPGQEGVRPNQPMGGRTAPVGSSQTTAALDDHAIEDAWPQQSVSPHGLSLIKRFEGFAPRALALPDGGWMIGHSHVMAEAERDEISLGDADELLRQDLAPIEDAVRAAIFVPLSQDQFDALTSFAFSVGVEHFRDSALTSEINAGRPVQAAGLFDRWRFAMIGGRACEIEPLVRRRAAEKALFLGVQLGGLAAPSARLRPVYHHQAADSPARGASRVRPSAPRSDEDRWFMGPDLSGNGEGRGDHIGAVSTLRSGMRSAAAFGPRILDGLKALSSRSGDGMGPVGHSAHEAGDGQSTPSLDEPPAPNDLEAAQTREPVSPRLAMRLAVLAMIIGAIAILGSGYELASFSSSASESFGSDAVRLRATMAGGLIIFLMGAYFGWSLGMSHEQTGDDEDGVRTSR